MAQIRLMTRPVGSITDCPSARLVLKNFSSDSNGNTLLSPEIATPGEGDQYIDDLIVQLLRDKAKMHGYFDEVKECQRRDCERHRHGADPSQPSSWHNFTGRFGDLEVETDHGLTPEIATVSDWYLKFR
ncbi:MAG: hypothetical protein IT364_27870 [Candidatus Hydrogenedentes bacterium]|nr:hypothetical protein [Candidatus Hydrogenedentota bacterium]